MSPAASSCVLGPLWSSLPRRDDEADDWRLVTAQDCRFCPAAQSVRTDWAQGDRVCTSCGVVQEEHIIDRGPEWRDYGDNDDHATAFVARCSLLPNQDGSVTTWSRSVYPSGSVGRSNHPVAQRLRKIHRTIERRMEMQQKSTLSAAALKIKLARKRLQPKPKVDSAAMTDVDTDNTDTATATINEEDDVPDYGSNVEWIEEDRPVSEFEQLLLHEERQVAQQRQALYAQKWSLERAKRLFGKDVSEELMTEEEEDKVLQQAARDVYTCYEILCQMGPTLQLPVAMIEESAGWLCQYAARRDGLKVKGIAIAAGKTRMGTPEEKLRVREAHKLSQMAALCAAAVFWIARERQRPRTLLAVCQSIQIGKNSSVAKKHCSRALQELKRCFPSFAPVPTAISCIPSDMPSIQEEPKDRAWSQQVESIRNRVEHLLYPLQLPPIAEAAVRYLVAMQCDPVAEMDPLKLPTRCAALTFLVCSAGKTLQQLAQQAQARPNVPRLWTGPSAQQVEARRPVLSMELEESDEDTAEQRAYEMHRMWDAWTEQLPWGRSGRSLAAAKTSLNEDYQQHVFPLRAKYLQALRDAVQGGSTEEEVEATTFLELERSVLRKTPLASVLLSHIVMAAPLMKMDLQL